MVSNDSSSASVEIMGKRNRDEGLTDNTDISTRKDKRILTTSIR